MLALSERVCVGTMYKSWLRRYVVERDIQRRNFEWLFSDRELVNSEEHKDV
jgi:hypothetical protein